MTAAMQHKQFKVALIERGIPGGQMNNTSDIENYHSYAGILVAQTWLKKCLVLENLGVEHCLVR